MSILKIATLAPVSTSVARLEQSAEAVSTDETSSYKILRWMEVDTERVGSQVYLYHSARESLYYETTVDFTANPPFFPGKSLSANATDMNQ